VLLLSQRPRSSLSQLRNAHLPSLLDVNPSQCSAATHQDVQVSKQRVNWQ
jgi:hypothetical protein